MHKAYSVKSRVREDFHARFCERVRVKLPRSTRPLTLIGERKQFSVAFAGVAGSLADLRDTALAAMDDGAD